MTVFKTLQVYDAQMFLQGMTNKVRCTFSVSDTTRAVHNQYIARQLELVTLYTIFSVVMRLLKRYILNINVHCTHEVFEIVRMSLFKSSFIVVSEWELKVT
jgi:hypothetical protein